ncbi:MAG: hypothetical protein ACK53Y_07920, partial [bacterium]
THHSGDTKTKRHRPTYLPRIHHWLIIQRLIGTSPHRNRFLCSATLARSSVSVDFCDRITGKKCLDAP